MDYMAFRKLNNELRENPGVNIDLFREIVGNEDVVVIPKDDPLEGKYGFIICTQKKNAPNSYREVIIQRQIHNKAVWVDVNSKEEFDQILDDNYSKGYKIVQYEDPVKRICGFMVFKGESVTWYHISLTNFRLSRLNSTTDKTNI